MSVVALLLLTAVQVCGAQVFPEVGPDDFEVIDQDTETERPPAVVYNPDRDVYLVISEVAGTTLVGQFLNTDGSPAGDDFILGADASGVATPEGAYDPIHQRYLITWYRSNQHRIMGLVIDDVGNTFFGPFVLSSSCGTSSYSRYCNGDIAFNPNTSEYLVTWHDIAEVANEQYETRVHARRIGNDGALLGSELDVGDNADSYGAPPRVAYNPVLDRFLVVWYGSYLTDGIYIRSYSSTGIGARGVTLISQGVSEDFPDVVFNTATNEYLVVWEAKTTSEGREIFGQRLDFNGLVVGENGFRISDMGPFGHTNLEGGRPRVASNSVNGRYLVAWRGENTVDHEYEIYGQLLDSDGTALAPNDFRISEMGGTGIPDYDAYGPAVAYASSASQFLVSWAGDDQVDDFVPVFGQRVHGEGPVVFHDGFEAGNAGAWSMLAP